jgi:hypothetical protein
MTQPQAMGCVYTDKGTRCVVCLAYVKSRSGDPPFALLVQANNNNRKQLKHLERQLLLTQELFEMQGRIASTAPENLHDLGPGTCRKSLVAAQQYFGTREALRHDDLHTQTVKKVFHALERVHKTSTDSFKLIDKQEARRDKTLMLRKIRLDGQLDRDVQHLANVLRDCPRTEHVRRFQAGVEIAWTERSKLMKASRKM